MDKLVEDYLNKMAKKEAEDKRKEKNKLLLKLGLYEKKYSENNEYSQDFRNREYDSSTGKYRYFKIQPAEVSDEEYAQILKYQEMEKNQEPAGDEKNGTATVFGVLAWIIFIVGFLAGIVLFFNEELSFLAGMSCWAASFVSGMFFVGISDALQLLTDIKNK